jgi:hypothetical protein
MPKRQTPEGVTIGFFGTGSMDVDLGMNLMEEYIDANVKPEESVRWVFLLTSDEFSDTQGEYVAMAKESDIAYEVIIKAGDKARRSFTEIANDAARSYSVEDPMMQLETILTDSARSALFVLWDKERTTEIEEILNGFIDAGIKCFDLTEGLAPLGVEEEEAETQAVAEPKPAPEPEEDEEESEGEDEDEEEIFARSDLEKMSRDELKEIAGQLNIPPRRSSEAMIKDILAAQGEPPDQEVAEVVPEVVAMAEAVVEAEAVVQDAFLTALDSFGERFSVMLDEFLTKLGTTLEGVAFNTTPEEPMAVEEPEPDENPQPRRRIVRRG